ncbi:DedA family protein [Streptomyces sp. NBC_00631]
MDVGALVEAAGWWSYVLVFALTAGETSAFVGVLLPGETVILLASAIAGRGDLNPVLLATLVVTGGITGDSLGYALGHWYGRRPNARLTRWVRDNSRISRAHDFLTRHGGAAVVGGRFIGFGVGDHHVHLSVAFGECGVEPVEIVIDGHVGADRDRGRTQPGDRDVELGLSAADEVDGGALGDETLGGAEPHAGGAPGDDHRAPLESLHRDKACLIHGPGPVRSGPGARLRRGLGGHPRSAPGDRSLPPAG